uniref:Uncharacterized protein n=1 Tax=Zonotrichia albicollis TaxID=44394 RepID=A0A8D2MFU6_ZONAL
MQYLLVLVVQNKIILPDWLRNTWKETPPAPDGQWSEGLWTGISIPWGQGWFWCGATTHGCTQTSPAGPPRLVETTALIPGKLRLPHPWDGRCSCSWQGGEQDEL